MSAVREVQAVILDAADTAYESSCIPHARAVGELEMTETTANTEAESMSSRPHSYLSRRLLCNGSGNGRKTRRNVIGLLLLLLLLATVAAVASIATLGVGAKEDTSATSPTSASDNEERQSPSFSSTTPSVVADYINTITLTGQTIPYYAGKSYLGSGFQEERALQWLIEDDDDAGLQLPLQPESQWRWRQRYALATLFISNMRSAFNSSAHEYDWSGVTCQDIKVNSDESGLDLEPIQRIVTEINLVDMAWRGTLSNDLGLLSHLQWLDVSENMLTGTLPDKGMIAWTNLIHLNLATNSLTGTLSDALGAMTSLQEFNVYFNSFSGTLPSSIQRWSNLTTFDVTSKYSDRGLSGSLPAALGAAWTRVEHFVVAWNSLTGPLPRSIGAWRNLVVFDVDDNAFTGTLPSTLSQWSNIECQYTRAWSIVQ
jgi:hypothetical protein